MSCRSRSSFYSSALALCILSVSQSRLPGAEPSLEVIRQQFETHQAELKQLFVHWKKSHEVLKPDSGPYWNGECRAAFKEDQCFYDIQYTAAEGSSPVPEEHQHRAMSYDGKETRILMLTKHARIWPGDKRVQFDAPNDFLALQGYPKSNFRIWYDKDKKFFTCDVAKLLQDGNYQLLESRDIDGTKCVQAGTSTDRLCFDPNRGYALVLRELLDTQTGEIAMRYTFHDFNEVQPGFWLARKIETEHFEGKQMRSREQLVVQKLDLENVSDELFSFQFAPGTTISDVRQIPQKPDGSYPVVGYTIPTNPEELDKVVTAAVKRYQTSNLKSQSRRSFFQWLVIANFVLIGGAILAFLIFRLKNKKNS